jgi:deoxycytidylate deaminase
MIINAGIKRVVYAGHYPDENAVAFLTEAGVELQAWRATTTNVDLDNEPAN